MPPDRFAPRHVILTGPVYYRRVRFDTFTEHDGAAINPLYVRSAIMLTVPNPGPPLYIHMAPGSPPPAGTYHELLSVCMHDGAEYLLALSLINWNAALNNCYTC